jgi:secondary thiamine-phosphate synthase enzyme
MLCVGRSGELNSRRREFDELKLALGCYFAIIDAYVRCFVLIDSRNVMLQAHHELSIRTRERGLVEFTDEVNRWVEQQSIRTGLLTLFCRHTSASLLIQENAAPAVRSDLEAFFERVAPEDPSRYEHNDEGADDMPAHLRTALTQVQLSIPVVDGTLALGTLAGNLSLRASPPSARAESHAALDG